MIRFTTLLFLASSLAVAENWSGYLVDSSCFGSEERNVNKVASPAERDTEMELRACSPNAKTKEFAIVLRDWDALKFDSAGNAAAANFVRNAASKPGKRSLWAVTVNGDRNKDKIKVGSISASK